MDWKKAPLLQHQGPGHGSAPLPPGPSRVLLAGHGPHSSRPQPTCSNQLVFSKPFVCVSLSSQWFYEISTVIAQFTAEEKLNGLLLVIYLVSDRTAGRNLKSNVSPIEGRRWGRGRAQIFTHVTTVDSQNVTESKLALFTERQANKSGAEALRQGIRPEKTAD